MSFGPNSPFKIIGHRGAAGVAPENTLPALRHAAAVGAHAVEFDIQCTRDGVLVVLHDSRVDRTTDGTGAIESMTLAEARELDAGHRFTSDLGRTFPYRGLGVRIPTLDEAIAEIGDLPAVVEIKSKRAGETLPAWLDGHPAAERILVGAFSRAALLPAAEAARWRCASEDELRAYVLLGKLGLAGRSAPDADAVMVPVRRHGVRIVTGRFVRMAHGDGLGVFVWTVNRPDDMRRLWALGVDGLITNDPGRGLRILDELTANPSQP